jgi:hypothetical protein
MNRLSLRIPLSLVLLFEPGHAIEFRRPSSCAIDHRSHLKIDFIPMKSIKKEFQKRGEFLCIWHWLGHIHSRYPGRRSKPYIRNMNTLFPRYGHIVSTRALMGVFLSINCLKRRHLQNMFFPGKSWKFPIRKPIAHKIFYRKFPYCRFLCPGSAPTPILTVYNRCPLLKWNRYFS